MRKHRILTDKIAKETINQEILAQNHPACNNIVHRFRRFHQKQSLAEQFAPTHFDGVEPKTQNKIPILLPNGQEYLDEIWGSTR
jgi:hypothetical protein